MNIVKRVFKLICICIFCIPIVACGRISRFEWNEVEYNKIAEMIDQKETFYALFKKSGRNSRLLVAEMKACL